jgi:undecaprenyl-diphosphatase
VAGIQRAASHPAAAAEEVAAGQPGVLARPWLAAITALCAVLFAADTYFVLTQQLLPFDVPAERAVQAFNWGPLVYVMQATNAIAGIWQAVFGLVVVVLIWLLSRRAGWLMLVGSIASLLDNLLKASVARHRPTANLVDILSPVTGYSYPSGHAVFYTWLSFMAAAGLSPRLSPRLRVVAWLVALFIAVMACVGRVWAGAHWPSDVLGGFLLALGWSAFVLWVPERWLPEPEAVWRRWRSR